MNNTVVMYGMLVSFTYSKYTANNGIYIGSIIADGEDEGMPFADFTVCLPGEPLNENEVIVPIYKLNKECVDAFIDFMVEEVLHQVPHGFALSLKVRLKPNWKELATEL